MREYVNQDIKKLNQENNQLVLPDIQSTCVTPLPRESEVLPTFASSIRRNRKKKNKNNKQYLKFKDSLYTAFTNEHIQLSSNDTIYIIVRPKSHFKVKQFTQKDH